LNATIEPVHPEFVGIATGIDARRPLGPDVVQTIHDGMDRYAVLILPGQAIDDDQQAALSRQLGPLQPAVGNNVTPQKYRRLGVDFSDVSNLDGRGAIFDRHDRARQFAFGNRLWHTDASYRAVPAKYSLLSARAVPGAGGDTEFADMRAAYDALDGHTRAELEGLVAEHALMYSRMLLGFTEFTDEERETFAPVRHTMLRTLDSTGRTSLYLSAHAGGIVGWPTAEARAFILDLMEHATRPEFVHVHRWQVNDLVIWDNRQTMHRVRRFDDLHEVRDMRRTTVRGDGPTIAQPD
jgi:alpha-ketoglutarate-dependent 2,4-dichlorophenoxyacetate dioxygenase